MGYIEWLRERVGHERVILAGSVAVLYDGEGRLLLQHRSDGRWGLPGGLMELGESCEETARREVFEETGLSLGALRLLGVWSGKDMLCRAQNGDEWYVVTLGYLAEDHGGELRVNDGESLGFAWLSADALPENTVRSHRAVIEAAETERRKR